MIKYYKVIYHCITFSPLFFCFSRFEDREDRRDRINEIWWNFILLKRNSKICEKKLCHDFNIHGNTEIQIKMYSERY